MLDRNFRRSALQMMAGTAIAQAVPIAVAPVLTRLYSPGEYGALGAFVAVVGFGAIIATGRYELAIVVASNESEARRVVSLAMALLAAVSVLVGVATVVLDGPFAGALGDVGGAWSYLVAPALFGVGSMQIASFWLNRHRSYRGIVLSGGFLQVSSQSLAIAAGLLNAGAGGLIVSRALAQLTSSAWLWLSAAKHAGLTLACASHAELRATARRFVQFPLFNAPNSVVSLLSRDLLVLLFAGMGQVAYAGWFTLTRTIIYLPVSFLSASLSPVYYREARDRLGSPEFERLTARTMWWMTVIFAPGFVWFAWNAPDLFALAFGEQWRPSGTFAALLAPAGYLLLFTSWPERLFETTGRQWIPFALQLGSLLLTAAVVTLLIARGAAGRIVVAAFAAIQVLQQLGYLAASMRVARFRWRSFAPSVALSLGLGLGTLACLAVLEYSLPQFPALTASALMLGLYYAILALRYIHRQGAEAR